MATPIPSRTPAPGITGWWKTKGVQTVNDTCQSGKGRMLDCVATEPNGFIVEAAGIQAIRARKVFSARPTFQAPEFALAVVDVQDAEKESRP